MAKIDEKYANLLGTILSQGFRYEDSNRKGTYRVQIQSHTFDWDFKDGFPALTTKRLYWKGIVGELLWFLRGEQNIKYLVDNDIHIWDKDAYNFYLKMFNNPDEEPMTMLQFIETIKKGKMVADTNTPSEYQLGDLGNVYGVQWRAWDTKDTTVIGHNGNNNVFGTIVIDQLGDLITNMIKNPMGTRQIVSAWNPVDVPNVALPPCHYGFIILPRPLSYQERYHMITEEQSTRYWKLKQITDETGHEFFDKEGIPKYAFRLKWTQRSVDTFLGLPFNIASYAVLAQIIGKLTNMYAEGITGDLSNVHIYEPHLDAVKEQLSRDNSKYGKCTLKFDNYSYKKLIDWTKLDLDAFLDELYIEDFELEDYQSYKPIRAEMLALKS